MARTEMVPQSIKDRLQATPPNGDTHDPKVEKITITAPRMRTLLLHIVGLTPLLQLRFSEKAMSKMAESQKAGSQARAKKVRTPKDFEDDFRQATHKFANGTYGVPAAAFRNACISACRLVGFKMTIGKMSIFIESDGLDVVDKLPLVRINGTPQMHVSAVRNASGVADLRSRAMFEEWSADVRVTFDLDQFSAQDVVNLMLRAGLQVGIGEGRPDSRESAGLGLGTFRVEIPKDGTELLGGDGDDDTAE